VIAHLPDSSGKTKWNLAALKNCRNYSKIDRRSAEARDRKMMVEAGSTKHKHKSEV